MKSRMLNFMRLHLMPQPGSRLIVAVSGGRDSVVLLHLLAEAGYTLEVAHMNYGLRGAESDEDELFVRQLSDRCNFRCHVNKVDARAFMEAEGLSLQEAARIQRYAWFETLLSETGAAAVAVAHHMDDSIETMLINMIRGTGIKGLAGIRPVNGKVIRPLLFAQSEEIERYAKDNQLVWRIDSSNQKDDYLRNKIRHHLVPFIKALAREAHGGLTSSMQLISAQAALYASTAENLRKELLEEIGQDVAQIQLGKLTDSGHSTAILYELLSPFGFNASQILQINKALKGQPGKVFYSSEYEAYLGSKTIEINRISEESITDHQVFPDAPPHGLLEFSQIDWQPENQFPRDPSQAWLDAETLTLPLSLRSPKTGDRFFPLGMSGSQKLSDYLINNHFSHHKKQKTLLLADAAGNIVWICGHRIAHPNRITSRTRKVLVVKLRPFV
ncbi:MAG TPA: tRNA lysidine(34) synthetase TilS [Bacteroidales bacterium]|nr:tRNA lysidine(34) synthetase TilS [Bacteroidales bacterium]